MQVILLANKLREMPNIVDVVAADKNLSVLGKGLKAAGLEEILGKEESYTVFAPTDLAFSKLRTGEWPDLLKPENKSRLAGIMNNHIVRGNTHFKDLAHGQKLKALSGKILNVTITNGDIDIEGSRIQGRDMNASNGVVHSLARIVSLN